LWLSPVQVALLPIGQSHREYTETINAALENAGIRTSMYAQDDSLGKRIREIKLQKIPYYIIIGNKELEKAQITIESRDKGTIGEQKIEEFVLSLQKEVNDRVN